MSLRGSLVRDVESAPIGRVLDVLLDPDSRDPRWLRVGFGDVDGQAVLVPAPSASEFAPGELIVPYDAATVGAARHDEGTFVSEAEAVRLRALYGFPSA
ncbi:PRC-barrel domain-containing protein [Jatrophihabitans fulvus]